MRGVSVFGQTSCENSSAGRAQPCQGWGREFESRFSLNKSLPFRGAFFVVGQGFPRVGNVGSLAGETAVDFPVCTLPTATTASFAATLSPIGLAQKSKSPHRLPSDLTPRPSAQTVLVPVLLALDASIVPWLGLTPNFSQSAHIHGGSKLLWAIDKEPPSRPPVQDRFDFPVVWVTLSS